ncbi:UNVERIFIED_CONTAM: hypothetical protein Slati_3384200 [Sesamum latifolium]|uniref:Uncharacterized protein n=1 Tax=Sesamum latifolium TaxID=2727402 RepID=A0AAW2UFH5_9LAMI
MSDKPWPRFIRCADSVLRISDKPWARLISAGQFYLSGPLSNLCNFRLGPLESCDREETHHQVDCTRFQKVPTSNFLQSFGILHYFESMAGVFQPMNFSDMKCDIPGLRGDNYKVWKERILLHLGWMDIDYAIRKTEPAPITETSQPDEVDLYEKWERSNRLSVMFIKTKISASIRGSVDQHNNICELLMAIDDQFVSLDKALAITLIMRFTSQKLTGLNGVREHIMQMRDIAAQLKSLEVEMSESFLVHYILNTLPTQYAPFKISYNTHKDKWSINELMTMCVQEERRLSMEAGESVYGYTRKE